MAKNKAKRAKNKHNSVETEKAEAIKKGEEIIEEEEDLEEVEEVEEEEVVDKFFIDNGYIVSMTYGNDDGSAYKTMILNYNNFAVRVVYEGIEYMIPAYEFVTIKR